MNFTARNGWNDFQESVGCSTVLQISVQFILTKQKKHFNYYNFYTLTNSKNVIILNYKIFKNPYLITEFII